jgi:hypothetical protein
MDRKRENAKVPRGSIGAAQYGLPWKKNDAVKRYNEAYAEYMSESTRRVKNNCAAALNSDFAPVYDGGLSSSDRADLDTIYRENVEPLIAAVEDDFRSVTKDLQEKYRVLCEKLKREKAAEIF